MSIIYPSLSYAVALTSTQSYKPSNDEESVMFEIHTDVRQYQSSHTQDYKLRKRMTSSTKTFNNRDMCRTKRSGSFITFGITRTVCKC